MRNIQYFFFFLLSTVLISCKKTTLFEQVPSSYSGIYFNNKIVENDTINTLDKLNIYNGGGVGIFDYDNDGDLDMYLTVNNAQSSDNTSTFRPIVKDGSGKSTGRLYRNDWDPVLKHPVFHDVSKQAGILIEGYGHAASIVDINRDGWKDIYVTNDFLSNNILYINNHDR